MMGLDPRALPRPSKANGRCSDLCQDKAAISGTGTGTGTGAPCWRKADKKG